MKGIIDIINETDGNTDEDLLVYSMTLVNKVLTNSIAVIFYEIFKFLVLSILFAHALSICAFYMKYYSIDVL